MTEITRGIALAGGVRIAYQVSGQGPALACCHAMAWDHTLWDQHRECFARTHQVITFDQRGSGDSDHPLFVDGEDDFYSTDSFGEDLRAVLDALKIETASILGYSMGAISALKFSTRWPQRVERLILVSAMASRLPEEIIQRARTIEDSLARDGLTKTYELYFSGPLFEGAADKVIFRQNMQRVIDKATAHGFQGCFRVTIDRPSMIKELKNISAPTLIMVGERDKYYVIEAALLVDKIPNAKKRVMKNAGHALTSQVKDAFEAEVMLFLNAR